MNAHEHYLDAERHLTYAADQEVGTTDEQYHLATAR